MADKILRLPQVQEVTGLSRSAVYAQPPQNRRDDRQLQSISEPWADTITHAGKMLMIILPGTAEL